MAIPTQSVSATLTEAALREWVSGLQGSGHAVLNEIVNDLVKLMMELRATVPDPNTLHVLSSRLRFKIPAAISQVERRYAEQLRTVAAKLANSDIA